MKQIAPTFEIVESNFKEFTFAEQLGFNRQLKSLRADLVHFGMTQQPVLYGGKKVTTVHDLTTVRFDNPAKKAAVFKFKQKVYKWVIKKVAKTSDKLLVPSKFVKEDVARFTHVNPNKITVTYEAADKIKDKPVPVDMLEGKKFIMYVGRPTPHKNLDRLIEAFQILHNQDAELVLALAGKADRNYDRIKQKIRSKKLQDSVVLTDFVSEAQLKWMYQHAAAYVFPSLSEGFGLPPLEAMTHGAPVVSSNATCLPEINGDAAHYFNPLDVRAMAASIAAVINNPALAEELKEKGVRQAAKYSWATMAEQTLAVYEKALK
jgi:glycosyltransferase involved in cell wall biosynthesis